MSRDALGRVPLDTLPEARLQTHHAVQVLTSFAQACVEPMEGDRHRNFDWDIGVRGFRARPAATDSSLTAVFAVEEFEVRLERADAVVARIPARGRTGAELRSELGTALSGALGRDVALEAPEFELPDHPTATDAAFDPDPAALEELATWFTHADLALLRVHESFQGGCDDIRVWPHHFDLATLLHADEGTLGMGLSPGDGGVEHPYWYVRGYPKHPPIEGDLPPLEHGSWKFEGWTGAILEAPEIIESDDPEDQDHAVDHFLELVIDTCLRLLG